MCVVFTFGNAIRDCPKGRLDEFLAILKCSGDGRRAKIVD